MIDYWSNSMRQLQGRGHQADTEALQTDVMRFMAILGLCLTAIFALLRSLPGAEPVAQADSADTTTEESELLALQQQVSRSASRLQSLNDEHSQLQKALIATRQELLLARESRLQEQRRKQEQQYQLQKLLQQSEKLQPVRQQKPAAAEAEAEAEAEKSNSDKPRKIEADIQQRPIVVSPPSPRIVKTETPPAAEKKGAKAEGLVLRFASESALHRLIGDGRVKLLGITGETTWSLTLVDNETRSRKVKHYGQYHEMNPDTVPERYWQHLRQNNRIRHPDRVTWGVQLPAETERSIRSLAKSTRSGILIIQQDASVMLQEERPG